MEYIRSSSPYNVDQFNTAATADNLNNKHVFNTLTLLSDIALDFTDASNNNKKVQ